MEKAHVAILPCPIPKRIESSCYHLRIGEFIEKVYNDKCRYIAIPNPHECA